MREFLSGNEAAARGAALCRPQVVAAYPITPQTTLVEALAKLTDNGTLDTDFINVESEHSALAACMGACAVGARTFTATSSQGLLYMAEMLFYVSGGRFPIVMVNANRALALPWNIYGDQSDAPSQLHSGWIQAYAENAQEALDLVILAYAVAEDPEVLTPFMVNLDGFVLTHTYEVVQVPTQLDVDRFLPPLNFPGAMDLEAPKNLAFTAGPGEYTGFKIQQHRGVLNSVAAIRRAEKRFALAFGRTYPGLWEEYLTDGAEVVLFTLGTLAGACRSVVRDLRAQGHAVGLVRLRYLKPFPEAEVRELLARPEVLAAGVLEKNLSSGAHGIAFDLVRAAGATGKPLVSFVGGLGGREVFLKDIEQAFFQLLGAARGQSADRLQFLNPGVSDDPL